MKRAIEAIKLGKDALVLRGKIQFGMLIQIIQNEHPSPNKRMPSIGQTSLHRLHSLHFPSSTINRDLKPYTQQTESLNYLLRKHLLTQEKLKGKEVMWLRSALIPVAPARKIFGERVLVVGDVAGMVNPVTSGGIAHAINGGMLAGRISSEALEKDNFSSTFLSQYQRLWQKTVDFSFINSKYLLSNVFLYLFKFDKSAYSKLVAITQGGIKRVFSTLKFIYLKR